MTLDHDIPAGQTPLDDKLNHRFLDVIREGEAARDAGTASPYHGHSLEHCLHATGWVSRDLRLALDEANKRAEKAEDERDDAISTLDAWFDRRELGHDAIDQAVLDCAKGYLRTSRVGGMPQDESDTVLAVIEDMARLSVFADLFIRLDQERLEKAEAEAARAWKVAHDATARGMAAEDERDALRADLRHVIDERDDTFALMLARAEKAEVERDALREAMEEIADGLKGIARDIQIGPDDEGLEIYEMVQALQWDARHAMKGHNQ